MTYTDQDRLNALGAINQASLCVRHIATKGTVDTDLMEPCIHSLFQKDADSSAEIFGPPGALTPGVRELANQLSGKTPKDLEFTRYLLALLKLESVLNGRPAMVKQIAQGIEEAHAKLAHFPMLHPNLLAHLADIYSRTLSQLQPRIMVRGESNYLQNPDNQNRIRSLLLAGVRAAWLWRQVGGSRWKILFGRHKLLDEANRYLRLSAH
jgi:high frequency lysogenization protein